MAMGDTDPTDDHAVFVLVRATSSVALATLVVIALLGACPVTHLYAANGYRLPSTVRDSSPAATPPSAPIPYGGRARVGIRQSGTSELPYSHLYLLPDALRGPAGFIDETGTVRLRTRYACEPFVAGLARFYVDGHVGFMGLDGRCVIPPHFDGAEDFSQGLAAVCKRVHDEGATSEAYRYGYIDRSGTLMIPLAFSSADSFSEGLAVVTTSTDQDRRFGYIDTTGRMVVAPSFRSASPFAEDRAVVANDSDGPYGVIDSTGSFVVPPTYRSISQFAEGRAIVCRDAGLRGLIDRSGRMVVQPRFASLGSFGSGLAPARLSAHAPSYAYGYIDSRGRWVFPPRFSVAMPFVGGIAYADGGLLRPDGSWLLNPGRLSSARFYHDGLWLVTEPVGAGADRRERLAFCDSRGRTVWADSHLFWVERNRQRPEYWPAPEDGAADGASSWAEISVGDVVAEQLCEPPTSVATDEAGSSPARDRKAP